MILTMSVLERGTVEIQRHKAGVERDKLQMLLGDLLVRPTCTCQLQGLTIDTATRSDVELPTIRSGCNLADPDSRIFTTGMDGVRKIRITNISLAGASTLAAELVVERDADTTALAPIRVPMNISFEPAAAGPAKPITACSAVSTLGNTLQTCPAGYALVGEPGLRSTFCVQQVPTRGTYGEHYTNCLQPTDPKFGFAVKCFNADWYRACRAGAFTVSPGQWEWTLGNSLTGSPDTNVITAGFGAALGGGPGGCNSTGARPINQSNYIRCCIYNGL